MTQTFIKAVEVWVPSADGWLLEFGGGVFGTARAFAALSRAMCFGRDEGLPGRAWEAARPLLLADLASPNFRRTAAARTVGLSCAVAVPYLQDGTLRAVLVIFCAHVAASAGALELWHDTGDGSPLVLDDGAYGPEGLAFEAQSRAARIPRGLGLPGTAMREHRSQFMADLGTPGFVRGGDAAAYAGLLRGLAIPVGSFAGSAWAVTVLASADLPLAHRIERWSVTSDGTALQRDFAFSELHGGHSSLGATLALPAPGTPAAGAIASAFAHGIPSVNDHPASEPGAPAAAAAGIGASGLVAIPVFDGGAVVEILVLYL